MVLAVLHIHYCTYNCLQLRYCKRGGSYKKFSLFSSFFLKENQVKLINKLRDPPPMIKGPQNSLYFNCDTTGRDDKFQRKVSTSTFFGISP